MVTTRDRIEREMGTFGQPGGFVRWLVPYLVLLDPDEAQSLLDQLGITIADVAALQTALDAKLDSSSYTAADVLTKLLTVDGTGSTLDADTVDGNEASALLARANHTGSQAISTVTGLQTALDGKQPVDADLTAIAALNTAAYGRELLETGSESTFKALVNLEAGTDFREILTATRTYYVRTDGSDSNNGLTDSSGGAFLTIQKAVDTAAMLDTSIYDVTISVGNGAFNAEVELKSIVGAGTVIIDGDTATPSNVTITLTGAGEQCFSGTFVGSYEIKGFTLSSTGTQGHGIHATGAGANVKISAISFGTHGNTHVYADNGAIILINGAYTYGGNCVYHLRAQADGSIRTSGTFTVTVTGTPAASAATVLAAKLGLVDIVSSTVTFSGSATGAYYSANLNGVIDTNGGGGTYLPGNSAGSTATGGQYG